MFLEEQRAKGEMEMLLVFCSDLFCYCLQQFVVY